MSCPPSMHIVQQGLDAAQDDLRQLDDTGKRIRDAETGRMVGTSGRRTRVYLDLRRCRWRTGQFRQPAATAIPANAVIGYIIRARQIQPFERRQRRPVVPDATGQHRIGWRFHPCAGAVDARLGQLQPRAVSGRQHPVILFPTGLFDRMGPGQREPRQRQARGDDRCRQPGSCQADSDHAGANRRFCRRCQIPNASAIANPIWSVSGNAVTSISAATAVNTRSWVFSGSNR